VNRGQEYYAQVASALLKRTTRYYVSLPDKVLLPVLSLRGKCQGSSTTCFPILDKTSVEQNRLELQYIKGIGPGRAKALAAAGIVSVEDVLMYLPNRHIDVHAVTSLLDLRSHIGESVAVRGKIASVQHLTHSQPHRLILHLRDESKGGLDLMFFAYADYLAKKYHHGEELLAIGKLDAFNGRLQVVHPEYIEHITQEEETVQGGLIPIYPMTAALTSARISQKLMRKLVLSVLQNPASAKSLVEILPPELIEKHQLHSRPTALYDIHFPPTRTALAEAERRLKYEELFFLQLRLALERKRNALRATPGIVFDVRSLKEVLEFARSPLELGATRSEGLAAKLLARLPFELTRSQVRVLTEIASDMSKAHGGLLPMHRLLQGDVGSGKTIVAVLAMLSAIENGYQCALMAPTEILAVQHYNTMLDLLKDLPIQSTLLVGGQRKRERAEALDAITGGAAHLVIGTHALLEESVTFDRLGFVVIDEQHRFGVAQRKRLIEKTRRTDESVHSKFAPDVLIMTATPIPRTLSLTLYGDLDVSTLDELPKMRLPIRTSLLYQKDHEKIYKAIRRAVKERDEQVYIVYPLVEESEKSDLAAAKKSFEELSTEVFPDLRIGLLHGKLSPQEKRDTMHRFLQKEIDVLVATTVIEVGIDVSNATVMIIEHAERFGLSQLHQLRGRVGRGRIQSHCVLVASDKLLPKEDALFDADDQQFSAAFERLNTMVRTNNGFEIAEVDLKLRGPGEFFGTKQSGLPELQIADVIKDAEMFQVAHDDASALVEQDPQLRTPEHLNTRSAFLARYQGTESFLQIG